jgi:hypothetical protein
VGERKRGILKVKKLRAWGRDREVLQEKETEKLERFVVEENLGSRKHCIVRIIGTEKSS